MALTKVHTDLIEGSLGGGDGANALTSQYYEGDGVSNTLVLSVDPVDKNNTQVYINGVYQSKVGYELTGSTITFSEVPVEDAEIEVVTALAVEFGYADNQAIGGMFKGNDGIVGTGKEDIFRINSTTLTANTTIEADENASAAGPLQIADTVALKVEGALTIV